MYGQSKDVTLSPFCRDVMVSEALPGVSGVHEELLGDEGLQDGFINGGLRPMHTKVSLLSPLQQVF